MEKWGKKVDSGRKGQKPVNVSPKFDFIFQSIFATPNKKNFMLKHMSLDQCSC